MKIFLAFSIMVFALAAYGQNVGIGEPMPTAMRLQVKSADSAILMLHNSTGTGTNIKTSLFFRTSSFYSGNISTIGNNGFYRMGFFTYGNMIASGLIERMSILDGGNVGIGTINPTALFEVNGTVKITDGTQGMGKVLTSDASGNASWGAAASGGFTLPYTASLSTTQTLLALGNDMGSCISGFAPIAGTYAVRGVTSAGVGVGASANSGIGLEAFSGTGNAGVFQSSSGLAIKTLGGNVEINGKIKMVDGTQGTGKVLTSSSDGTASWALPTISAGFTANKIGSAQSIPSAAGVSVKIDFGTGNTSQFGTSYNASTSQFTAPVSGFYQFNVLLSFTNPTNAVNPGTFNNLSISLRKSSSTPIYSFSFINTAVLGSQGFSTVVALTAGETVDVTVLNSSGTTIQVDGGSVNFANSYFSGYRIN